MGNTYCSLVVYLLIMILLSACATIVGENTQVIPISSIPTKATILITDETGVQVYSGLTPTSAVLNKSNGKYWGNKQFVLEIAKVGFKTQEIPITSSVNGWYIGGNLIFGNLIGWLIVDPLNGGMFTLSPLQITATLDEKEAGRNSTIQSTKENELSIVLLEDVPASLRSKMIKVDSDDVN